MFPFGSPLPPSLVNISDRRWNGSGSLHFGIDTLLRTGHWLGPGGKSEVS